MTSSEKVAIAAHLHVLLRRKTGRVTDTEWLAANVEYATEIVKFARAKALEDGHPDLAEWAGKLEAAVLGAPASDAARKPAPSVRDPLMATGAWRDSELSRPAEPGAPADPSRYVRGIR
jgi:hypothetical protein